MISLDLYRVFYAVAKCGSLTKASQQLYISQPAISLAIKHLEEQIGTPLFYRTHRGMCLTEQGGKQIFDIVEKALLELDSAEIKIKELNNIVTGTLIISASDTIFSYLLLDKLIQFHEKNPTVKLNLINCITTNAIELLRENKCDIAFINLPVDDKDFSLSSTVMPLQDTFVAGKNFQFLTKEIQPIAAMQNYPILMLDTNTITRRSITEFMQSIGVYLMPHIDCGGSIPLMVRLAKEGMGIACLPREYVAKELENKELFEIETYPKLPTRSIGIAFPKNKPIPLVAKEFFKLFQADMKENES